ncbi:hypothetical protein RTCIAT899_PC06870 (plasmid) [Rhizobium tropici CIAT 899]|nr:hypothetical protein RTCIAT899_PC06870 [Rhizobium tropici CIAT 899]
MSGKARHTLRMGDLMRPIILLLAGAAIFAAPCVYDPTSNEPSALASIAVLWGGSGSNGAPY